MHLTQRTDLALRVLTYLVASSDDIVPTSEIEKNFRVSRDHLKKVIPELALAGWVETLRGRNGGVRLSADTTKLRVSEVVERFEPLDPLACFRDDAACPISPSCMLKGALWGATQAYLKYLGEYSIADITQNRPYLRRSLQLRAEDSR